MGALSLLDLFRRLSLGPVCIVAARFLNGLRIVNCVLRLVEEQWFVATIPSQWEFHRLHSLRSVIVLVEETLGRQTRLVHGLATPTVWYPSSVSVSSSPLEAHPSSVRAHPTKLLKIERRPVPRAYFLARHQMFLVPNHGIPAAIFDPNMLRDFLTLPIARGCKRGVRLLHLLLSAFAGDFRQHHPGVEKLGRQAVLYVGS